MMLRSCWVFILNSREENCTAQTVVRNIKIKDDVGDADSKIGEHNLNEMFNHMGMDAGLALDYPATAR